MKRHILLVLLAILWVSGCPGPSDPCDNVNCVHGICQDGVCECETACWTGETCNTPTIDCGHNGTCQEGICECNADWYGELCDHHDQCRNLELNTSLFLASMVLEAGETGTMTVEDAPLSGSYLAVNDPDTVTEKTHFVMGIAVGANVPMGFYPLDVTGPEVLTLKADQPYRLDDDGKCVFNEVELGGQIEIFINRYGSVLFHNGADWVYPSVENGYTYQITENGVLISTAHTSPYYVLNTIPQLMASCVPQEDRTIVCDLTGSEDDGFSLPFLFPTVLLKDGDLEVVLTHDGDFSYHSEKLDPGTYNFTAEGYGLNYDPVSHPEDKAEEVLAPITIEPPDPCADVVCEDDGDLCNGTEECVDGDCEHLNPLDCNDSVGCTDDSCDPVDGCQNPANHANCTNNDVCDGAETCDPILDCQAGTLLVCDNNDVCDGLETCDSVQGCQNGTPLSCDNGDVCDGLETCDSVQGCQNGTPLSCDNGDVCDGLETCHAIDGCQTGTAIDCGNGDCVEPGTCNCDQGYTGSDCSECDSGYYEYPADSGTCVDDPCLPDPCNGHGTCANNTGSAVCSCYSNYDGSTCNSCAPGYGNYPTCAPVPTISNLNIDCGAEPCWAGGTTYPVTFSATNATSCSASMQMIVGAGPPGSVSACVINGNSGSFDYTTAMTAGWTIRLTVQVTGPGGNDSDYTDVILE